MKPRSRSSLVKCDLYSDGTLAVFSYACFAWWYRHCCWSESVSTARRKKRLSGKRSSYAPVWREGVGDVMREVQRRMYVGAVIIISRICWDCELDYSF